MTQATHLVQSTGTSYTLTQATGTNYTLGQQEGTAYHLALQDSVYDNDVAVMLAGAVLYLDTYTHDGSQTWVNAGTGGTALNALNGGGTAITTNDAAWLEYDPADGAYVYLPGSSSSYLSVPDSAPLSVTGDIDIRIKVDMPLNASTQTLVSKGTWSTTASYRLEINSAGNLIFYTTPDGSSSVTSVSAAITPTEGTPLWIRVKRDVDNGAAGNTTNFYTSTDGSSWSAVSDSTNAGVTSIYNSSDVLEIGSLNGGSNTLAAKVLRVVIYSDLTESTKVLDVDTSVLTSGAATSFTEASSNAATVTINRPTLGRKPVAVVENTYLLGTDDFLEIADNALLDFTASDSFTVLAVVREWQTPANYGRIVEKRGAGAGWTLVNNGVTLNTYFEVYDGVDSGTSTDALLTAGSLSVMGGIVDRSAETVRNFLNGDLGGTVSTSAVGDTSNGIVTRIGGSSAGGGFQEMELVAVAVFRRTLSAGEVAGAYDYFTTR